MFLNLIEVRRVYDCDEMMCMWHLRCSLHRQDQDFRFGLFIKLKYRNKLENDNHCGK